MRRQRNHRRGADHRLCQVPGCSRAGEHTHHLVYRSQGGKDIKKNLVAICPTHHLHGVHLEYIHVEGEAPDGLRWELGVRAGLAPLAVFSPSGLDAAFAFTP